LRRVAALGGAPIPAELALWARARGLCTSARSLLRYRERLDPSSPRFDGNVDARGRGGAGGCIDTIHARVRDEFVARAMHRNCISRAEAWRWARDVAETLGVEMPSLRAWQLWFARKYPEWARKFARRPREFEAACQPKIQRDNNAVEPLEWVSLDGHVLNVLCRTPDVRRGWRQCRPILTGVLDIRTRMFVGWDLRGTEHADGILAGIKRCISVYGCPRHYYADNGHAYTASVGGRRRARLTLDDPRIGNICAQTGAQRHNALPYQAWSKMIESHWHLVIDRFERCWPSFFGNIGDRPEVAGKLRLDQLPTVEEVAAAWGQFLVAHHAEPMDALGGLSPNLAMEQFRTQTRRLDPDVLDFLCTRTHERLTRLVTRDGVSYNGTQYGQFDLDVLQLQGRTLRLRIEPDRADYVWLCELDGTPICQAHARRITGATQEEVREAARVRAAFRRLARQYRPARDFLEETTPQQIMRTRAAHAQAREQLAREQLPPPPAVATTIVRPDLVEPVRRIRRAAAREALHSDERQSVAFELLTKPLREPAEDEAAPDYQADRLLRWGNAAG